MSFKFWRKRKREKDLDEELTNHIEMAARDRVDRGETPVDAAHAARSEFGNTELVKETTRDAWGWRWAGDFAEDVKFGLRTLRTNPGFTAAVVLTLALGIGANTSIFRFVNAVVLRELEVRTPSQLVFPRIISPEASGDDFPYAEFEHIRDHSQSYSGLIALDTTRLAATVDGQPNFVLAQCVSASYFSVLGVNPILGSDFAPRDNQPGQPPEVVISYSYWKRKFALDPGVLSRNIVIKQISFRIAGVAPETFHGVELGASVDLWLPMGYWPRVRLSDHLSVAIMARLKPGVTKQSANGEIGLLDREYIKQTAAASASNMLAERKIELQPGARGFFALPDELPNELNILMMVVGLVLLIACANVANLLLARAVNRRKEIALRLALGAGRLRLLRQLLTESLLLAVTGGATGLLLADWATRLLLRFHLGGINPMGLDVHADRNVLWFAAGVSLLTGLVFGLAPAFDATKVDPLTALKSAAAGQTSGESRKGLGRILIVAQVALCVSLLVGAGLMLRSLKKLSQINPGFLQDRVLLASIYPTLAGYEGRAEIDLYSRLAGQIAAAPGVLSASMSRFSMLRGGRWPRKISNPNSNGPEDTIRIHCSPVAPQFFATMEIPHVLGRDFAASDGTLAPKVAIISESLARAAFPNQNPIGTQIRFVEDEDRGSALVVGVVADVRTISLREPDDTSALYIPLAQAPPSLRGQAILAVRTPSDPSAALATVRSIVKAADPGLLLTNVATQAEHTSESFEGEQSLTTLLSIFSALAVALAAIGLYGVVAYSVARRTHEIGIRVALGAGRRQVLRMVLAQGLQLTLAGIAIGMVCAAAESRILSNKLFGVTPTDPATFTGVALLLTSVALLACYIPARRAMKIDPVVALRYE